MHVRALSSFADTVRAKARQTSTINYSIILASLLSSGTAAASWGGEGRAGAPYKYYSLVL